MPDAVFIRLLSETVEDKAVALQARIAALNAGEPAEETFVVEDEAFGQIPGSPFAYWVSEVFRALFRSRKLGDISDPRQGLATTDDFRFVRCWWETHTDYWYGFAKGGSFSPFFSDVHLLVDWGEEGARIKESICLKYPYLNNKWEWVAKNSEYYFRPGLTWPRRTNGFSVRVMPAGCIFADKGPAAFVADDDHDELLALAAIMNSAAFEYLVRLQLARTELAQSYEVGLIQNTPVPDQSDDRLAPLALRAHDLQRENYVHDETTHVFGLPGLVAQRGESLAAASLALDEQGRQRQAELAQVQAQIDDIVFDLYGLGEADRQAVMREMGAAVAAEDFSADADESDDEEEVAAPETLAERVQNLLMWCVGVAFGRWDVRKALDPTLIPPLPGPFDPLPRCAPGALMNAEGLPAAREDVPDDYPLPIAWDGVLLDDPEQESNPLSRDIVARVRGVLTLLWDERADRVEREICAVLGVQELRDYFRHPSKGFFSFHIKRYSKSRRKAPIYWLLQSSRRSRAVWLYYPRINENTLFIAENLLSDQLQREHYRLEEYRKGLAALSGADRKRRERAIEAQMRLIDELNAFLKPLRALANLKLVPDFNDGVLISIAPLHELVPWKEAAAMWQKLVRGEYAWSSMSQRIRQRGLRAD